MRLPLVMQWKSPQHCSDMTMISTEKATSSYFKRLRLVAAMTFIELVIVASLLSFLSTLVIRIFRGAEKNRARIADDLDMQSRALLGQNQILRILREGKELVLPALGEDSSALCFIDNKSDLQVLFAVKDSQQTEKIGKKLYKLMHYTADSGNFDPTNPSFNNGSLKLITSHLNSISFRPSNANSVTVMAAYETETRRFQIVFEGGLMNYGDY